MQRIDLLILQSREDTDNSNPTADTGIPDSSFLKWVNAAQRKIYTKISNLKPKLFQKEQEVTSVAQTESYSVPSDLLLGSRIEKVEYSVTGQAKDYYQLALMDERERFNGNSGTPIGYIRQSENILIQPKPGSAGLIRTTYQRKLPKLDKRRGTISAVTLSSPAITSLTIDSTTITTDDITDITNDGYISIVDKDGNITMQGIPVTAIDSSTGVVTVSTFSFQSTETIAVGSFVCVGTYSSTHSALPDVCEDYLTAYIEWKGNKKDSSTDQQGAMAELAEMESYILEALGAAEANMLRIPEADIDYL